MILSLDRPNIPQFCRCVPTRMKDIYILALRYGGHENMKRSKLLCVCLERRNPRRYPIFETSTLSPFSPDVSSHIVRFTWHNSDGCIARMLCLTSDASDGTFNGDRIKSINYFLRMNSLLSGLVHTDSLNLFQPWFQNLLFTQSHVQSLPVVKNYCLNIPLFSRHRKTFTNRNVYQQKRHITPHISSMATPL